MSKYIVYTDGGAHNERGDMKGIGAWAFVEKTDDDIIVYARKVKNTTNNRTEMMAVINAISHYERGSEIEIISDSGYVVKGYTDPAYLDKWILNDWKTSSNKQVSNIELWKEILLLSYHYVLKFTHIRGHNKDSNPVHAWWNSIVDNACTFVMRNIHDYDGIVKLKYDKQAKKFDIMIEVI